MTQTHDQITKKLKEIELEFTKTPLKVGCDDIYWTVTTLKEATLRIRFLEEMVKSLTDLAFQRVDALKSAVAFEEGC